MSVYSQWKNDIPCQFRDKPNLDVLIRAFSKQLEELLEVFEDLKVKTTLDGAEGQQLDMLGTIVGISRSDVYELLSLRPGYKVSDDLFRNVLKFQILKNNANGTYAEIMKGIHLLWGDAAEITFIENGEGPIIDAATIMINIQGISVNDSDPLVIRPMVIKAGGVRLLFRVTYEDTVNLSDWEIFNDAAYYSAIFHRYDGEVAYDGSIHYMEDAVTWTHYDASVAYDGSVPYDYIINMEELGMGVATMLNQAKRKVLHQRFAGNPSLRITHFVFGDGVSETGTEYTPDPEQTGLRNQVWQYPVSVREELSDDAYQYLCVIPRNDHVGETITEMGLVDTDGMVVCIITFPAKVKSGDSEMVFKINDSLIVEE